MGPAERADVIMDFRNFAPGTRIVLLNIAPDEPFGGGTPGQDFDPADPETTGQVMLFEVVADTDHGDQFDAIPALPGIDDLSTADNTRYLSLNEEESAAVCVLADEETGEFIAPIEEVPCDSTDIPEDTEIVPFGPIAALLGTMDESENPELRLWADAITETPLLDDIENWRIANFTEDAHPIHIHMVQFQIIERVPFEGGTSIAGQNTPLPGEEGYKDTVIAYPGEITTVRALFDKPGQYVWHCHILEHEDNEMMRAFYVKTSSDEEPPAP
jgi:FtsP/CotA-like multicopper oxidase with cupredoxin domain